MFQGAEQYFKGLTELGQQFFQAGAANQAQASWAKGMEGLMQATGLSGQLGGNDALMDRLMDQSKAFLSMLEQFYKADGKAVDFSSLGQQWLEDLAKQNPFANMGGFDPQAMLAGMSGNHVLQQLLNTPAFGLAREHQERQQALIKHLMAYQQANQEYQALMSESIKKAVDTMQSKLGERAEPGRELDSLKAVYDLWIDALEESFAEIALSDSYQKTYGKLVDAQMRVRQNIQTQIELATGQVGMPTRTELEGVHQKLAEVRRQLRAQSSPELDAIKAELAELRAELAAIKRASSAGQSAREMAQGAASVAKSAVSRLLDSAKRATAKSAAKPATKVAAKPAKVSKQPVAKTTGKRK